MPFMYVVEGLAPYYEEFAERLLSELALRGTEITNLTRQQGRMELDVKYTDEKGHLTIYVEGDDVKVSYTVERARKEVGEGAVGAVTGGALGGFVSSLLRGDKEAAIDVLAGALAGGTLGAYHGYERAVEEATMFAQLLAETARGVEDYLKTRIEEEAERRREEIEEIRSMLDEMYGDLIALKEEVEIAAAEGKQVTLVEKRISSAEKLCEDARQALEKGDVREARIKATAARKLLERAQNALYALV